MFIIPLLIIHIWFYTGLALINGPRIVFNCYARIVPAIGGYCSTKNLGDSLKIVIGLFIYKLKWLNYGLLSKGDIY
jgi:hypothetical protein